MARFAFVSGKRSAPGARRIRSKPSRPAPALRAQTDQRPQAPGADRDVAPPESELPSCASTPPEGAGARPSAELWATDPVLDRIRREAPGGNQTLLGRDRGSRGPSVRLLQQTLLAFGCERQGVNLLPQFGADGVFGAETERAVRLFQREEGLTADGIVGPLTLARLDAFMQAESDRDRGDEADPDAPAADVVPPRVHMAGRFTSAPRLDPSAPDPTIETNIEFPAIVGGVTGPKQGWVFHVNNIRRIRNDVRLTRGSARKSCRSELGPGLDNDYPFNRIAGTVSFRDVVRYQGNRFLLRAINTADAPATAGLIQEDRFEEGDRLQVNTLQRFRMFLVWDTTRSRQVPDADSARPVALGFVDWGFRATGVFRFSGGAFRAVTVRGNNSGGGTLQRGGGNLLLRPVITNEVLVKSLTDACDAATFSSD